MVAGHGEEDVLQRRLLLDVLHLRGWEKLLELGERAAGDDPTLVEDCDPIGKLFGQERVLATAGIARMNLLLHGVEDFRIVRDDTLRRMLPGR